MTSLNKLLYQLKTKTMIMFAEQARAKYEEASSFLKMSELEQQKWCVKNGLAIIERLRVVKSFRKIVRANINTYILKYKRDHKVAYESAEKKMLNVLFNNEFKKDMIVVQEPKYNPITNVITISVKDDTKRCTIISRKEVNQHIVKISTIVHEYKVNDLVRLKPDRVIKGMIVNLYTVKEVKVKTLILLTPVKSLISVYKSHVIPYEK